MRSKVNIKSHPLHPMLVAFPIALWTASLICDLLGLAMKKPELWSAGFYAIVGGCIGAVLAAIPGAIDWKTVVPPNSSAKTRGLIHGSVNTVVLILFIIEAVRRGDAGTTPDRVAVLLSVIGVALVSYSGWLGGTL